MSKPTVVCLRTGDKYTPDYVWRLRNMVARHLPEEHDFICFTDDAKNEELKSQEVKCVPPPCDLPGWWGKVGFFKSAADLGIEGRMLFLDLDSIICGDLTPFVSECHPGFVTLKHWKKVRPTCRHGVRKRGYNSSVMFWNEVGSRPLCWKYINPEAMEYWAGDQDWLKVCYPNEATYPLEYITTAEKISKHCGPLSDDVRIVVCNSLDNHTITHWPWVKENWK